MLRKLNICGVRCTCFFLFVFHVILSDLNHAKGEHFYDNIAEN